MTLIRFSLVMVLSAATAVLAATLAGGQAPVAAIAVQGGYDVWAGIRDVGFPITAFMLLYTLLRGSLSENTKALVELRLAIGALMEHCKRHD